MPVLTPLAGKYGRVTANGVNLAFEEWRVEGDAEDIKTPHFELATDVNGQHWMERFLGIADAVIAINGFYDDTAGRKAFVAPVGMYVGATITTLSLSMRKGTAKLWTWESAVVQRAVNSGRADNGFRVEFRVLPNGAPTATPA